MTFSTLKEGFSAAINPSLLLVGAITGVLMTGLG